MKSILNKENKTEEKVEDNKPRVVIASKLKITREKLDRYGNVIEHKEQ